MNRGDQQSGRDPDRFDRVVMFQFSPVGQNPVGLREDGDQPGCHLEKWFVRVRPECSQRFQPFVRRAVFVKFAFLRFGRDSDLMLQSRIAPRRQSATVAGWPR